MRLSHLAPATVLICLLLDASLRLLPPQLVTFRAWESMTLFATGSGPFVPNTVYRNSRSSGDLASFANLPLQRQYREEVFTTDAAGYRNRHQPDKPFTGILLVGDSFAAGSGVSDPQTLGEQLHAVSGLSVYNGAETARFWQLLDALQMQHGLVVWQQSERDPLLSTVVAEPVTKMQRMRKYALALKSYSPLRILSGRAVKFLQNDELLPNPYWTEAPAGKLRNGQEMLFLRSEVKNYGLDRPANPEGFAQLKLQLQKRGLGLLVLLVPDKYAVYSHLLLPTPPSARKPYLAVVEEHLAAAGIPVINLTTRFRDKADTLLNQNEYLYWLDDTHWNAKGIREAAQAVAASKAISECQCR